MKKIIISFLLALSICVGGFAFSKAHFIQQNAVEITIIVGTSQGHIPRSPAQIPIHGYAMRDSVYLEFDYDIGEVIVEIEDQLSGEYLRETVDSSDLFAEVGFSGEHGSYNIYFTLENGLEYTGFFNF